VAGCKAARWALAVIRACGLPLLLTLPSSPRPDPSLAPALVASPRARDTASPGSLHHHAVVFAAPAGFANEFYALAVDSFVRDADRHGGPQTLPLGVHVDWLTGTGTLRRSVFLDCDGDRLVDTDWIRPLVPDSVQFLCLGPQEQALHRELSARFRCPQINPYDAAAAADDKAATLARWHDLETPASLACAPGQRDAARAFASGFDHAVVKPVAGTEGNAVCYLDCHRPDFVPRLVAALETCWVQGVALVQQRRDGIGYRDPSSGRCCSLALRLNLVHDGYRHRVTSAYAQIGRDAASPAACGRGGRIIDLHRAGSGLVLRTAPEHRIEWPDAALWRQLGQDAERAAARFPGLALVGLDLVLDRAADGRLAPVFLEANPRPAGLCRSRLLTGMPSPHDPIGVGLELWDGLARLRAAALPHRAGRSRFRAAVAGQAADLLLSPPD